MKKIIVIAIVLITLNSGVLKAQAIKKDTTKKPVYEKFVKVSPAKYANLMNLITDQKRLIMYDPLLSPEEKEAFFQSMDNYEQMMRKNGKVDSALIKKK